MDETVLIYIEKANKYLLMYRNKKKNDMNQGKYVGIGGHIENGESKEDALIREVKEETNLTLKTFKYRAKLVFTNDDYSEYMHLYTSDNFIGELTKNCNEGDLMWIDKKEIFNLPIWEGDRAFLKVLEETNDYFEMVLTYSGNKLVKTERIL